MGFLLLGREKGGGEKGEVDTGTTCSNGLEGEHGINLARGKAFPHCLLSSLRESQTARESPISGRNKTFFYNHF